MAACYFCSEELTSDNRSWEHVLPNSIGGRWKSDQVLCKTCNATTGQLYDTIFARFANMLASKYNIKRERGQVQNETGIDTDTGHELIIKPGYDINYRFPVITKLSGNRSLITSSTLEQNRQAVQRIKKQAIR